MLKLLIAVCFALASAQNDRIGRFGNQIAGTRLVETVPNTVSLFTAELSAGQLFGYRLFFAGTNPAIVQVYRPQQGQPNVYEIVHQMNIVPAVLDGYGYQDVLLAGYFLECPTVQAGDRIGLYEPFVPGSVSRVFQGVLDPNNRRLKLDDNATLTEGDLIAFEDDLPSPYYDSVAVFVDTDTSQGDYSGGSTCPKDIDRLPPIGSLSTVPPTTLAPVTGAPGEQGPTGPKGEKGEIGDQGPQGTDGEAGPTGPPGQTGDEGSAGGQGDTGIRGQNGEPGPTGPEGEDGPIGIPGSKGDPGQDGIPGAKGDKGDVGLTGPDGEQGAAGQKGEKGEVGPQGPSPPEGVKGDKGDRGETGDPGLKGEAGRDGRNITFNEDGQIIMQGDKGDKGDSGANGRDGTPGAAGSVGPQGPKGDVGPTGPAGPAGGPPGPPGPPGDVGPKGEAGEPGTEGGNTGDGRNAEAVSANEDDFWSGETVVILMFIWLIILTIVLILMCCVCGFMYRKYRKKELQRERYVRDNMGFYDSLGSPTQAGRKKSTTSNANGTRSGRPEPIKVYDAPKPYDGIQPETPHVPLTPGPESPDYYNTITRNLSFDAGKADMMKHMKDESFQEFRNDTITRNDSEKRQSGMYARSQSATSGRQLRGASTGTAPRHQSTTSEPAVFAITSNEPVFAVDSNGAMVTQISVNESAMPSY